MSDRRQTRTVEPADPADSDTGPQSALPWSFPRLASPDSQEQGSSRPAFSRRRLVRRSAMGLGLGVLSIAALFFGRKAVDWLNQRPEYLIPFAEIELEPAPPPYIRHGQARLLEKIRERAGLPETISILAMDPADLARIFPLHSPWIEQVDEVRKQYPNRLVIRLTYREPVGKTRGPNGAWILLAASGAARGDGKGGPPLAVVLDGSELDESACGPLFLIEGLEGPIQDRPGLSVAPSGADRTEAEAVAAVRLAAYLRARLAEGTTQPLRIRPVAISVEKGADFLFIQADTDGDKRADGWILWGEAPGQGGPGELSAERKWGQLKEWFGRKDRPGPKGDSQYLRFTEDGPRLYFSAPPGRSETEGSGDRSGVSPGSSSH